MTEPFLDHAERYSLLDGFDTKGMSECSGLGNRRWRDGLFEAMAYQGSTRYVVAALRPSNTSGEALFALAGPTGDSPDVITRETLLPADMDVGDKVIVRNAGAYSLSVTSEFNGFPKPAAYLI